MKTPRILFPRRAPDRGFTLIEILLALAIVGLLLVGLNTFIFSMSELWGRNNDVRLFEQHTRAVTRFLEGELRAAAFPPAARAGSTPILPQEIRPESGSSDDLLTFELPEGSRLISWPDDRPLPEVICSLQVRPREGLFLLWHSRLEKKFNDDPPHETLVTPLVSEIGYDYYDEAFKSWKTETRPQKDPNGQLMAPQRLRLKFLYNKQTRETDITLPVAGEGLPNT